MAQPGPTVGAIRPGGGTSMWKRSLQQSVKLSRLGRLVKAPGHHTMMPNALLDMRYTMLVKKPTRRSMRILTPSPQKIYSLANQLRRENADVVGDKPVKNDAGEMSLSEDSKQKSLVRALPKAPQH